MKMRLWSLLLVTVLTGMAMTGCRVGSIGEAMQSAGKAAERGAEAVGEALIQSEERSTSAMPADPVLTPEEAKQIALKHAGLTAGLVTGLHAEYEMEHGTPIYDVEFHSGNWEYDYEIHADTGDILSFSKDD